MLFSLYLWYYILLCYFLEVFYLIFVGWFWKGMVGGCGICGYFQIIKKLLACGDFFVSIFGSVTCSLFLKHSFIWGVDIVIVWGFYGSVCVGGGICPTCPDSFLCDVFLTLMG